MGVYPARKRRKIAVTAAVDGGYTAIAIVGLEVGNDDDEGPQSVVAPFSIRHKGC